MLERQYQTELIKEIERRFPGVVVLKNDTGYRQGIPDLTVLHSTRWAALEVKRSWKAETQPNQPYWVDLLNKMSYAAFIYPENERDVLDEIQYAFQLPGRPRLS